jgi:hypothetical protein
LKYSTQSLSIEDKTRRQLNCTHRANSELHRHNGS